MWRQWNISDMLSKSNQKFTMKKMKVLQFIVAASSVPAVKCFRPLSSRVGLGFSGNSCASTKWEQHPVCYHFQVKGVKSGVNLLVA